MFTPTLSPEVQAMIAAGPSPGCMKCQVPVTVQMTGSYIKYCCHGKEEVHPYLVGWKHPDKAFL